MGVSLSSWTQQGDDANMSATTSPAGASLLSGCSFCQSPVAKQGLFFAAIVLFAVSWHTHLYSLME